MTKELLTPAEYNKLKIEIEKRWPIADIDCIIDKMKEYLPIAKKERWFDILPSDEDLARLGIPDPTRNIHLEVLDKRGNQISPYSNAQMRVIKDAELRKRIFGFQYQSPPMKRVVVKGQQEVSPDSVNSNHALNIKP
jgi:hypothetical protein